MRSPFQVTPVRPGPALRRRRLPLLAITVSTIGHGLAAAAVIAWVIWGGGSSQKVYVVNLVPAVAAVGSPSGATAPALPPRPATLAPSRSSLPEPEPREARAREAVKLPDSPAVTPRLPSRPAALPRPGEKELPPLGAPAERRAPAPPTAARAGETPTEARPAPPPPLGQTTGSVSGTGALTLDVSDFPHAWYLRQVLQKVEERWQKQGQTSEPSQKPLVLVDIQRDGSIRAPKIEKSSGNAFYDQAALRAIADASPFPPLPQEWSKPSLRVLFRFELRPERG
ncbi:MAG: TonB family protein [Candidatus Rokubacteria bacterium]|nr:TonB family protein [Candidatus Rokubacteria bacterium]MBI3106454.1 TonB family protein [Candidatus Rokubacteria bacterium]